MKPKYIFQSFFIEKILLSKRLIFAIVLFFVLATSHQSKAQLSWDVGAITTNWIDAANWFPDSVPTATGNVTIDCGFTVKKNNFSTIKPYFDYEKTTI